MRFHVLTSAALLAALAPVAAKATLVTTNVINAVSVSSSGVNQAGSTTDGKYTFLGGSAVTAANNPSFVIEEFNGAAILSSLQAASGVAGGTATSLTAATLNVYDGNEPPPQYSQYATSVAGGIAFAYANATVSLPTNANSASTPVFDTTAAGGAGGFDTQLGATDSLGTASYAPTTNNTDLAYGLTGAAGDADILNAINAGQNFYVAIYATSTTTRAQFGGLYGNAYGPSSTNGLAATPSISIDANISPVPEPASLGLIGSAGLLLLRRRRNASV